MGGNDLFFLILFGVICLLGLAAAFVMARWLDNRRERFEEAVKNLRSVERDFFALYNPQDPKSLTRRGL